MSAAREAYIALVTQTSRNPDAGLPINEEEFDAILDEAGMTRADFAGDWQMIREIREELAREHNANRVQLTDSERFPTSTNGYKTRVI
jgi:hypothetical protein